MVKKLTPPSTQEVENPWDDAPAEEITAQEIMEVAEQVAASSPQAPKSLSNAEYDMEGLMTDFPTAKELERFVFDETGVVLNLKGRANKLKYQVAMDVLNGQDVEPHLIGKENPYIDKADMVPVEDLKDPPKRDPHLPPASELQNSFHSRMIPHIDEDLRAQGRHCEVTFRKYNNGVISYEINGPWEKRGSPFKRRVKVRQRLRK